MRTPALLLTAMALLSGCTLHRPQAVAPPTPPAAYLEARAATESPPLPDRWWDMFADPRLDALMADVFAGNLDLEQGYARLQQAEAALRTVRGAQLPSVALDGSAGRARQSTPLGGVTDETYRLSAPATFEIDLWRKLASRTEATRLDAAATREELKSLYLTLSGRVADLYFLAVEQRVQLELADRTIAAFEETLERVERRYREGLVPPLDVYQSRQNLATARARRPQFENTLAATEHALAVLAGRPPDRRAGDRLGLPSETRLFPTGVPSEVLARRPDIEGALLRLRASDARIAAAIAERFPALTLTGSYGGAGSDLRDLLSSGNIFWNLLMNLSQPLFDGGRREAEVDRNRALFRENLARYHQSVLTAFREVEDALAANRTGEERIVRLRERVTASEGAHRLALSGYLQGLSDYLPVLTAQGALFEAESQLLSARRQRVADLITLARALGGRWMAGEVEKRFSADSR